MKHKNGLPKISIVVPVLNAAVFIDDCLNSIIDQKYPNIELIVMDGGSSDGTREIIKKHERNLYYWESKPDKGQSNAINNGFRRATGDIRAWLNADEEYYPGLLNKVGRAFQNDPSLDFIYGNRDIYDKKQNYMYSTIFPKLHPFKLLIYANRCLPTDASFWSKYVHEATGEIDELHCQHLCMDSDWHRRISVFVRNYLYLNESLSKFKEHENRKTPNQSNGDIYSKQFTKLSREVRFRIRKELGISRFKLFFGWLLWSTYIRLFQEKSIKLPSLRAIKNILTKY